MRTLEEINDIGRRALVDALGSDDAERFMAQLRTEGASASTEASAGVTKQTSTQGRPQAKETTEAEELPPQTVEEAHKTIRDMQDPMAQQHML